MYWGGVTSIIISLVTLFAYSQNPQNSQNDIFIFVNFSQSLIITSSQTRGIFLTSLRFLLRHFLLKQRLELLTVNTFFLQKQLCTLVEHFLMIFDDLGCF